MVFGSTRPDFKPRSVSFSPNAARVASSTILISVTLLKNGTVRLERGFTSITYTLSFTTTYWIFNKPLTLRFKPRRFV